MMTVAAASLITTARNRMAKPPAASSSRARVFSRTARLARSGAVTRIVWAGEAAWRGARGSGRWLVGAGRRWWDVAHPGILLARQLRCAVGHRRGECAACAAAQDACVGGCGRACKSGGARGGAGLHRGGRLTTAGGDARGTGDALADAERRLRRSEADDARGSLRRWIGDRRGRDGDNGCRDARYWRGCGGTLHGDRRGQSRFSHCHRDRGRRGLRGGVRGLRRSCRRCWAGPAREVRPALGRERERRPRSVVAAA